MSNTTGLVLTTGNQYIKGKKTFETLIVKNLLSEIGLPLKHTVQIPIQPLWATANNGLTHYLWYGWKITLPKGTYLVTPIVSLFRPNKFIETKLYVSETNPNYFGYSTSQITGNVEIVFDGQLYASGDQDFASKDVKLTTPFLLNPDKDTTFHFGLSFVAPTTGSYLQSLPHHTKFIVDTLSIN